MNFISYHMAANERTLMVLRQDMAYMRRGLAERLEAVEARHQIASPRQVNIPRSCPGIRAKF